MSRLCASQSGESSHQIIIGPLSDRHSRTKAGSGVQAMALLFLLFEEFFIELFLKARVIEVVVPRPYMLDNTL
jgi:hypothetical protein